MDGSAPNREVSEVMMTEKKLEPPWFDVAGCELITGEDKLVS